MTSIPVRYLDSSKAKANITIKSNRIFLHLVSIWRFLVHFKYVSVWLHNCFGMSFEWFMQFEEEVSGIALCKNGPVLGVFSQFHCIILFRIFLPIYYRCNGWSKQRKVLYNHVYSMNINHIKWIIFLLQADMESYIPLETAAIFFLANLFPKQGISSEYVTVDFICMC